ncbi:MAG TPA: Rieske 2Fe-2S domain-containing protein [Thermomicrobiales bacterium]|nr:Rieske 2Fe-2S domain-containing protein [Thermomicrobiales bacterium]
MTSTIMSTGSATLAADLIRVGRMDEIENPTVVSGGRHGIAVFLNEGKPFAVDNRCPHMGFPLHQGSVRDGILTCHWHHARFDLASGGTFDPWADDVRTYRAIVDDGVVFVDPAPKEEDWRSRWKARLHDGLEQDLNLVMVKAVLALQNGGVDAGEIVEIGGRFGATYRERGWTSGLTILAAMANVVPFLNDDDKALALYHGMVHVAGDCAGQPPHFVLDPLPTRDVMPERIKTWFRSFVEVRDRDGAERALLTAINSGVEPHRLADLLLSAATDHVFLDGGHTLDFVNKACEMLDLIGWQHSRSVLPSVIPSITMATRSEELNNWRHPVDLVALVSQAQTALESALAAQRDAGWRAPEDLIDTLLGDDPDAIVDGLINALAAGAPLTGVTRTLSYAAAVRVAKFHTSNEFSDWITVLHTFTYANALHQAMQRAPSAELTRGILHGAMRLYLDRFLNMPAARLPEHRDASREPDGAGELLARLLELTDREQRVNEAGLVVHRYLSLGHDPAPLIATLGHVLLREDGEFHSYQMLEAGIALFGELRGVDDAAANRVIVAVARYLAAHAPTSRSMLQTARTATRLHRGEAVYEAPEGSDETDDPGEVTVAAGN